MKKTQLTPFFFFFWLLPVVPNICLQNQLREGPRKSVVRKLHDRNRGFWENEFLLSFLLQTHSSTLFAW